MRPNLSLVTLGVHDFQRSLKFYRDGLSWPVGFASDDVAFFRLPGIVFAIHPRDMLAKDATVSAEGSGFSGITLAHNTRSEQEVDDVLKTAKSVGATIIKPAQKVYWGGYSGYFADPDGHLWEVAFNPHWTLDSEGRVVLP